MRTTVARLVTLTLLVSACSAAAAEPTTTSTTSAPTTTTSTSTTTTVAPTTTTSKNKSLLNGLPVSDPSLLDRRVLAIKIDNHPAATPQSGVDKADMVIELMVEGITRWMTFWHESDSDYLGPNRSGRPTDGEILTAFNNPTFVISGAQAWVQNLLRSKDINLIKELSEGTFRISSRRAPHNLYVDTNILRQTADARGYPDEPPTGPIWQFGPLSPKATPASKVTIDFLGNIVTWTWDTANGLWLRSAYNEESMYVNEDGTGDRIGVPVLIALYVEQYTIAPGAGQSGKALPGEHTIGSGKAYVFADGKVVEGTWTRDDPTKWFTLTDADGNVINVPPGKSWVSLVPQSRGLTID